MMGNPTENAAMTTILAFHYQVLIGLDKCFSLRKDQSVWFEKDGDVSLRAGDALQSSQTEVKNHAAQLTDHHENLWKTLKNWLASSFEHDRYGALILHTTQSFSRSTRLKNWNSQDAEQRLNELKTIYYSRPEKEREASDPSQLIQLQKKVIEGTAHDDLIAVLDKVLLHVEADDLEKLREEFCKRLDGYIPQANQKAFSEGLIGFVYEQASSGKWEIEKNKFDQNRESLTSRWGPKLFTIPDFSYREATDEEVSNYIRALFAQKIMEIEYHDVLPEAIGNWLELRNSLFEEFDGYPQFRKTVNQYREQWARMFSTKYRSALRKAGCRKAISQDLYDQLTGEVPFGVEGYPNPDFVFRNGLIHDVMDDEERGLKWKVVHE